jgi:hypothetical protein
MSEYEEHFAPNASEGSDNESIEEKPMKRYATRSQNETSNITSLKKENIKLVKEKIKKDESEQVRYLSLDNATKEVEIEELKEIIKKYEMLIKPIKQFEEVIKKIDKNNSVYMSLIGKVNSTNYKDLMVAESQQIEVVTLPTLEIPEIQNTLNALQNSYNVKKATQDVNRENFHEILFWNATSKKRKLYFYIETFIGFIIFYALARLYLEK